MAWDIQVFDASDNSANGWYDGGATLAEAVAKAEALFASFGGDIAVIEVHEDGSRSQRRRIW